MDTRKNWWTIVGEPGGGRERDKGKEGERLGKGGTLSKKGDFYALSKYWELWLAETVVKVLSHSIP